MIKYADSMSKQVIPPMSKSEILELSQKTLLKIMGKDAAPTFVKALQKAAEPVLKKHLEVPRMKSSRRALYRMRAITMLTCLCV